MLHFQCSIGDGIQLVYSLRWGWRRQNGINDSTPKILSWKIGGHFDLPVKWGDSVPFYSKQNPRTGGTEECVDDRCWRWQYHLLDWISNTSRNIEITVQETIKVGPMLVRCPRRHWVVLDQHRSRDVWWSLQVYIIFWWYSWLKYTRDISASSYQDA